MEEGVSPAFANFQKSGADASFQSTSPHFWDYFPNHFSNQTHQTPDLIIPRIETQTLIRAPIESCFDAARDIGLHCRLAADTGERAVAGRIKGLIGAGEWVTFSAVHFGLRLQLTAHITQFEAPRRFVDEQTRGPFAHLKHTHEFEALDDGQTRMRDTIEFAAPFGPLGKLAAPLVAWHLGRFLERRNVGLKGHLESGAIPHK